VTPDQLAHTLQLYLAEASNGAVVEEGEVLFGLSAAQYSISCERERCLLHLWSDERNIVRHVVDAIEDAKHGSLILTVKRFGQPRPNKLEICRDRDRRTPSAKNTTRSQYARLLERLIRRQSPDWKLDRLSTTMDLERSFSPVYARGLLRKGQSSFAVFGVNHQETQASVDAALTFALLWLDYCREREAGSSLVEGLRVYVPHGRATTLQIRMAHLNHARAKFQLFELDARDETLNEIDTADHGNIETRLLQSPNVAQTRERFAEAIDKVLAAIPNAEVAVPGPAEIVFRLHGLEFAKVRAVNVPGSFQVQHEFVFGSAGYQSHLTEETQADFDRFTSLLKDIRNVDGDRRDPLWRMYPERWLESLVFADVAAVDSRLNATHVYSQVPAFTASDRAMIDILTCTHDGRLAVIELKADEDINLPLQGLDYWARVRWHHARGEFQPHGYFSGVVLSPRPPLLILVAPSMRVHPSTDIILSYFSQDIEWSVVGLDERWREGVKVVFRKRSGKVVVV
jgi:hypothetical protein